MVFRANCNYHLLQLQRNWLFGTFVYLFLKCMFSFPSHRIGLVMFIQHQMTRDRWISCGFKNCTICWKKCDTTAPIPVSTFTLDPTFAIMHAVTTRIYTTLKRVKVGHTGLPSVGFRSWSRFLAASLQVTWVINPAVGCRYFPPGPQLPPQSLRGLLPILLFGEHRHNGCEEFA